MDKSQQDEEVTTKDMNTISRKPIFRQLSEYAIRTKKRICKGCRLSTCYNIILIILVAFLISAADQPLRKSIANHLLMYGGYLHVDDSYPVLFRLTVLAFIMFIIYFICVPYIRQLLLCALLSYQGWLYQDRSKSIIVKIWGLLLRILNHAHPKLHSYQGCIPRMSVPPLKSTMDKLLQSMKPLMDNDEYKVLESNVNKFLTTIGPKLQWHLYLKSWWSSNFCIDWWNKYAYLSSRDPISNNSNYIFLDQIKWIPSKRQTSRAAGVTSLLLQFKSLINSELLEPIMLAGKIPLCMSQYERLFSTTRIPRTDGDVIKHSSDSSHIVVLSKGHFYKVNVVDPANQKPLNHLDFERLFDWIAEDTCTWETENEHRIASLTSNNRSTWANCQREHFTSGVNRRALDTIEEAIFVVVLDDKEFSERSDRAKYLLHGDGATFWFDKSFCAVFFTDGRMGLNVEHSWGDGLVIGHLMEYVFTHEYLYRVYDDDGFCQPYISTSPIKSLIPSKTTLTPIRIHWDIDNELMEKINESFIFATKRNENIDICADVHDSIGKGYMKIAKINPDAFIQMAFQLAYYKDSEGQYANTYESSMTRLFLHGRTETVRPFTEEVKDVVIAMNDPNVTATEKFRLISTAAKRHQEMSRECMGGKGIDRHLFALYIISKKQGMESLFLKTILTMPWRLSTSQGPPHQMNHGLDLNNHQLKDATSTFGAYAPSCEDGYGIMYALVGDSRITFQISSYNSCPTTNSKRFMENIFWAFLEMKMVIDESRNI